MSRFKPRTPKWRKHATREEILTVEAWDRGIAARKNEMATIRKAKARFINEVAARAQAHAGREEPCNG